MDPNQNQMDYLERLDKDEVLLQLFFPSKMKLWMRPIGNPYLVALYRQATSWIDKYQRIAGISFTDKKKEEQVAEKFGLMSPEAFQSEPEEIFSFFK